jgi:hypothetical protein
MASPKDQISRKAAKPPRHIASNLGAFAPWRETLTVYPPASPVGCQFDMPARSRNNDQAVILAGSHANWRLFAGNFGGPDRV